MTKYTFIGENPNGESSIWHEGEWKPITDGGPIYASPRGYKGAIVFLKTGESMVYVGRGFWEELAKPRHGQVLKPSAEASEGLSLEDACKLLDL